MHVTLAIPFRDDGCRLAAFKKTVEMLRGYHLFDEVMLFDSQDEPFSRAATRNLAVESLQDKTDVIVLCDADSVPEYSALEKAIEEAYSDGRVHVPHTSVSVLPRNTAHAKADRIRRTRPLYSYGPSCGGVFVFKPSAWIRAGGMDERIIGWGYEDQIFLVALRTFGLGPVYHDGILINFQHPRGQLEAHRTDNESLRDFYNANINDKEAIRVIQRGSNGFCPNEGP